MNRLLAQLSAKEEIALRRVANGAFTIDAASSKRLHDLALIEVTARTMRLTPLGQKRYDSLAKAPLATGGRSVRASINYIESILEKAEALRASRNAKAEAAGAIVSASPTSARSAEPVRVIEFLPLPKDFSAQAHSFIAVTCERIMTHRRDQIRLVDSSLDRVAASRDLLKRAVPVVPPWLAAFP